MARALAFDLGFLVLDEPVLCPRRVDEEVSGGHWVACHFPETRRVV